MTKILFSANDAGGGNAIFPVIKALSKNKQFEAMCIAAGPAKSIFQKEKIKFIDADKLSDAKLFKISGNFDPAVFISGTDFGFTVDKKLLLFFKHKKIKTIAILDFWVNYRDRFSEKNGDFKYLPDIVCVMDKRAKKEMVDEGFDPSKLIVTGNPYFDYFSQKIKKNKEKKNKILFISQPYSEIKNNLGYDEFVVLNDLVGALNELNCSYSLILRPHPREGVAKFKGYSKGNNNVKIDNKTSIEKLISDCGLIIGMNSMVLFQAAIYGKRVISYQPDLGSKDALPSNGYGLSILIKKRKDLLRLIKKYLITGQFPVFQKNVKQIIIKGATRKVTKLIINI